MNQRKSGKAYKYARVYEIAEAAWYDCDLLVWQRGRWRMWVTRGKKRFLVWLTAPKESYESFLSKFQYWASVHHI